MLDELIPFKNWVVTFPTDKIPLNPYSGQKASVNDPLTWSDYATANACVQSKPGLCLGFVLTNAPFVCIDLDSYKTQDATILANHKEIYDSFDTYSELSPSGGVHIWCKGSIPSGKRLPQQFIEMYCSQRYITITGNALRNSQIHNRQELLNELYAAIDKKISPVAAAPDDLPETQSDDDVCRAAASAVNGELFKSLYLGQWQQCGYPSQSEADQALVNIIAFYSDNKKQVARIFHASALGQRKKAHRDNYLFDPRYGIITRAFDQKLPNVTFANLEQLVKGKVDETLAAVKVIEPTEDEIQKQKIEKLPEFVQEHIDFDFDELPPGLVGEIAQFIYANAVRPVKEIAISAAIAYMAGLCGKSYNISRTGLNHYIAVLAQTAGGKEGAASGMERLTSFVREKVPQIDQFIGPAEIASPQALIKQLATVSPCFISHKGEMGFWLQKLTHKYAKQNETMLRGLLLDLYTKSGRGQIIRGSIYSDKTKDIQAITAPALTLFGDATPDTFYKALDEENVEEGLVSRFTIVECSGAKTVYNEAHGTIVPDDYLVQRLAGIVRRNLNYQSINSVVDIQETPEAHSEHMRFMQECYDKTFADRDTAEGKLYSRAHLRLLRLAGLIAVGVNADCPVMDSICVQWAKRFIVHGIGKVALRFAEGAVGEVNYYVEQKGAIRQIIKRYWLSGYKEQYGKTYNISREMFDAKVITNRYIQTHILGKQCFRRDRNPQQAFRNVIQEYIDNGILLKVDMAKIRDSGRQGIAYYITDLDAITK